MALTMVWSRHTLNSLLCAMSLNIPMFVTMSVKIIYFLSPGEYIDCCCTLGMLGDAAEVLASQSIQGPYPLSMDPIYDIHHFCIIGWFLA